MIRPEDISEWRGKDLLDRDGDKIGKLEDVYVDTETDVPMFGTVKEGTFKKHLTFVPFGDASATPDGLKVAVSKEQVKDAPDIDTDGELDPSTEAALYQHYGLGYAQAQTPSGRRLGRR